MLDIHFNLVRQTLGSGKMTGRVDTEMFDTENITSCVAEFIKYAKDFNERGVDLPATYRIYPSGKTIEERDVWLKTLSKIPYEITTENIFDNLSNLKAVGALPGIQMYDEYCRVNNETLDWDNWNGCVFVDVDSKNYINFDGKYKEYFKDNLDLIIELLVRQSTASRNILFFQQSASRTSFHFVFYFDTEDLSEEEFRKCNAFANETVRRVFLTIPKIMGTNSREMETLVDDMLSFTKTTEKGSKIEIFDKCGKSPTQICYLSPYTFHFNKSCDGSLEDMQRWVESGKYVKPAVNEKVLRNGEMKCVGEASFKGGFDFPDNCSYDSFRVPLLAVLTDMFGTDALERYKSDWLEYILPRTNAARQLHNDERARRTLISQAEHTIRSFQKGRFFTSPSMYNRVARVYNIVAIQTEEDGVKLVDDTTLQKIELLLSQASRSIKYGFSERLSDNQYITDYAGRIESDLESGNVYLHADCGTGKSYLVKHILQTHHRVCVIAPLKSVKNSVYVADLGDFTDYRIVDNRSVRGISSAAELPDRFICGWEQVQHFADFISEDYLIIIDESHLLIEHWFRKSNPADVLSLCTKRKQGVLMLTGTPCGEYNFLIHGYTGYRFNKVTKDIRFIYMGYQAKLKTMLDNPPTNDAFAIRDIIRIREKTSRVCVFTNHNFDRLTGWLDTDDWTVYRNLEGKAKTPDNRRILQEMDELDRSHILRKRNIMMTSYFSVGCEIKNTDIDKLTIIIDNTYPMSDADIIQVINRFRKVRDIECIIYAGMYRDAQPYSNWRMTQMTDAYKFITEQRKNSNTEQIDNNIFLNDFKKSGGMKYRSESFDLMFNAVSDLYRMKMIDNPQSLYNMFPLGVDGCRSITVYNDIATAIHQTAEESKFYNRFFVDDCLNITSTDGIYDEIYATTLDGVMKSESVTDIINRHGWNDEWCNLRCQNIRYVRDHIVKAQELLARMCLSNNTEYDMEKAKVWVKLLISNNSTESVETGISRQLYEGFQTLNSTAYNDVTRQSKYETIYSLYLKCCCYGMCDFVSNVGYKLMEEYYGGNAPEDIEGFDAERWKSFISGENKYIRGNVGEKARQDDAELDLYYKSRQMVYALYFFKKQYNMANMYKALGSYLDKWTEIYYERVNAGKKIDKHFFEERNAKGKAVGKAKGKSLHAKWVLIDNPNRLFYTREELYEYWKGLSDKNTKCIDYFFNHGLYLTIVKRLKGDSVNKG